MRFSKQVRANVAVITAFLAVLVSTGRGETIYYAVSHGKNLARQDWHAGDLDAFTANRPENVYDLYTLQRQSDGKAKVSRDMSSPSGDWFLRLTYLYGKDGRLTRIDYDFSAFHAHCSCGARGPARSQRLYRVDTFGRLHKISETVTDLNGGNRVNWSFDEPTIRHWAKLTDLPVKPR